MSKKKKKKKKKKRKAERDECPFDCDSCNDPRED